MGREPPGPSASLLASGLEEPSSEPLERGSLALTGRASIVLDSEAESRLHLCTSRCRQIVAKC